MAGRQAVNGVVYRENGSYVRGARRYGGAGMAETVDGRTCICKEARMAIGTAFNEHGWTLHIPYVLLGSNYWRCDNDDDDADRWGEAARDLGEKIVRSRQVCLTKHLPRPYHRHRPYNFPPTLPLIPRRPHLTVKLALYTAL